uniref:NADH-ubiquinone oxidoreductase chain 4 n=1 Tax=Mierspenaeopsis hardwickii TaxID=2715607 RepID=A0A342KBZ2_9EUCA|nr:NADH dehydrogenase subunit 4 [Mierspenaeopsis hardwickii]ANF05014.1 NADH dehydrogenase subunit 4 [Mierspenaeopsis hardwickii]
MLKFVLCCMLLMPLVNFWWAVQGSLFVLCFLFAVFCHHDFNFFMSGRCLGVDSLGYILILLSFWITTLVVCSSQKILKDGNYPSLFLVVNIALLIFLVFTFSATDYLLFYISFESSLVPTLILILGWGYQPERLQAGVYMLFYTLFASLPLLLSLISFYMSSGSLTLGLVESVSGDGFMPSIWYLITVFAFIVKLPMFLVHLWLPKAHVEAPVAGSMILAGVLLKLGGYGLIRVLPLFSEANKSLSWVWVSISLVGGVVVSLMCLRQVDIKALIAYSSVAHMGLVLSGLVVFGWWGLNGAVVVMVGHGLCSSGLFCLANMVYERVGSRSLLISKGLMNFMPSMALWWFLLSAGNMAAPPTLNLLGEISLIISVVSWSTITMVAICLLSFFSAAYTLYMFSLSQHGKYYSALFSCCSGKVREYLILMLHWLPLNILILKSSSIMFIL